MCLVKTQEGKVTLKEALGVYELLLPYCFKLIKALYLCVWSSLGDSLMTDWLIDWLTAVIDPYSAKALNAIYNIQKVPWCKRKKRYHAKAKEFGKDRGRQANSRYYQVLCNITTEDKDSELGKSQVTVGRSHRNRWRNSLSYSSFCCSQVEVYKGLPWVYEGLSWVHDKCNP